MAKMTTVELLAKKRKEVAELEARLFSEIQSGAIAIVRNLGRHEDIPVGELVRVDEIDRGEDVAYPITCRYLNDSDYDDFKLEDIEIVTRERAREILIEQVDVQLAKAFGPATREEA